MESDEKIKQKLDRYSRHLDKTNLDFEMKEFFLLVKETHLLQDESDKWHGWENKEN